MPYVMTVVPNTPKREGGCFNLFNSLRKKSRNGKSGATAVPGCSVFRIHEQRQLYISTNTNSS